MHRALGDPHRLAVVDALQLGDRTPGELAELTGLSSNLLAFHLEVLEEVGLVARGRSEGDGRRRYVRLVATVPDVPASVAPGAARHVLFVCTRNASRSQLAAALWTARTGRPASSAGREPADRVDPTTVAVARAAGLDLAAAAPHGFDALDTTPDLVVTVCDRAGEADDLPFADVPRLHWSVPDPVGRDRAAVEAAHRDLASRVERLAGLLEVAA